MLVLQLEIPIPAVEAVARRARAAGARVLLNFAPYRADALHLLPHATHLIVNETECALIAEALGLAAGSTAEQAAALAARYGNTVIATLGRDGVIAIEGGRTERAPALPVNAIDTVGAGDTFCGYLGAALAEGMALSGGASAWQRPPRASPARRRARSRLSLTVARSTENSDFTGSPYELAIIVSPHHRRSCIQLLLCHKGPG